MSSLNPDEGVKPVWSEAPKTPKHWIIVEYYEVLNNQNLTEKNISLRVLNEP